MNIKQNIVDILQGSEGNHSDTADKLHHLFFESLPQEVDVFHNLAGSEEYCKGQIDLVHWIHDKWIEKYG